MSSWLRLVAGCGVRSKSANLVNSVIIPLLFFTGIKEILKGLAVYQANFPGQPFKVCIVLAGAIYEHGPT
jgi:hypothetical protein